MDVSPAYLEVAQAEAERQGHRNRIEYTHGDFVELTPGIESADIVKLARVICCSAVVYARYRLVDVRSPEEFRGEKLHMPDYPQEGAMCRGHIPGAKNVPWARAVNPETGEFRSAEELRTLYEEEAGPQGG